MNHRQIVSWGLIGLLAFSISGFACAEVRSPKVAGQFYPEETAELRQVIQTLLQQQPESSASQKPRILLVPHAGYQYSGLIAASGYRRLQGRAYHGVVVVGFSHRMSFAGSSVDTQEAYLTPLGEIPVDREAVAVLQTHPGITHLDTAHESGEHSLEVQLPFLQVALERLRIVPVLMSGNPSLEDAQRLAEALAALSRVGDYLFVFTTDLSHYHPYAQAQERDERAVNALLTETPQAVFRLLAHDQLEACGHGPIVASLLLAAKLGHLKRELLMHANSGDTTGDTARVVGYATLGMFERPAETAGRLSETAGAELVRSARASLEHALVKRPVDPMISIEQYPELAQASGVFVTLRKRGALRGCIGRIQTDEPLAQSVPKVALDSALRDARFAPVTAEELPQLHVEVSVLTPPEQLADLNELVPGRDGVILEAQGRHGVFLPQVWDETGWTRVEFLRELASQKAGLLPDAWQGATLHVFQDQIFQEEK